MVAKLFAGNYRWFVVSLLFVATTINYLDRQLIGLLKPILETEFAWTETDFAHIVMAFTAAYAIGLTVSGGIIDRIGTKLGFAAAIIVWSIAGMGHALVKSVTGFSFVRVVLGFGEAANFPAAAKAVAEWFPKRERAVATGIFNAGPSVGVVLSLLIVPIILQNFGWREVFWITGGLGFVWLVVWWIFYETPLRQKRLSTAELELIINDQDPSKVQSSNTKFKWQKLFTHSQTWALIAGKGLIDPIFWFFLFWLPSYFSSTFSLDLKKPSLQLMTIYLAATIGSIGGGYLSSWMIKKGWPILKARKTSLLIFACLELSIMFTQFASSEWVAVLLISLAIAVHQAWATNVFTMASDMFPVEAVSSVVGIAGTAGSIGGILFPILIGYLLDTYKALGNITAGYHILFTLCSVAYLVSLCIIHFLTRKSERLSLEQIQ